MLFALLPERMQCSGMHLLLCIDRAADMFMRLLMSSKYCLNSYHLICYIYSLLGVQCCLTSCISLVTTVYGMCVYKYMTCEMVGLFKCLQLWVGFVVYRNIHETLLHVFHIP